MIIKIYDLDRTFQIKIIIPKKMNFHSTLNDITQFLDLDLPQENTMKSVSNEIINNWKEKLVKIRNDINIDTIDFGDKEYELLKSEEKLRSQRVCLPKIGEEGFMGKKVRKGETNGTKGGDQSKFNLRCFAAVRSVLEPPSLKSYQKQNTSKPKQNHPKILKHLYKTPQSSELLRKQQRYFQNIKVRITQEKINKLGLYQCTNIFKKNNINPLSKELKIKSSPFTKKQINTIQQPEMFLTNINTVQTGFDNLIIHIAEGCDFQPKRRNSRVKNKLNNDLLKYYQNEESNLDSRSRIDQTMSLFNTELRSSTKNTQQSEQLKQSKQSPQVSQFFFYITFTNYKLTQDEHFNNFKRSVLNRWPSFISIFKQIRDFLTKMKIGYASVRTDNMCRLWDGQKISQREMYKLLKVKRYYIAQDIAQKIVSAHHGRMTVKKMKAEIKRKNDLARWVCTRMITKLNIKTTKKQNLQKSHTLHHNLLKDLSHDIQIFLPSFSMSHHQLTTTQYMQSYEQLFLHIWSSSKHTTKEIILILPSINSDLLELLQSRMPINRKVSFLCPQIYDCFPAGMPLAAHIWFSYDTLFRLREMVGKKKAVIIPGVYQEEPYYEMMISKFLNIPILASLLTEKTYQSKHNFFSSLQPSIKTPICTLIPPNTSYQTLTKILATLILENLTIKKYLLKINNEFKGRGTASFTLKFHHKKQQQYFQNEANLFQYLQKSLKLSLKPNNQNSLYIVQEFLQMLGKNGGIIEEQLIGAEIYEVGMFRGQECQVLGMSRAYGCDYVDRVWLTGDVNEKILQKIEFLREHIKNSQYYGYLSCTIAYHNNTIYSLDLKPYLTHQTTSSFLTSHLDECRHQTQKPILQTQQLNPLDLQTKRKESIFSSQASNLSQSQRTPQILSNYQPNQYQYLIIPNIVLPDIQHMEKVKFIQFIMERCYGDRYLKVLGECCLVMSMGVSLTVVIVGKNIRKIKKKAIDLLREIQQKMDSMKKYIGKQPTRDVVQIGDIIRGITQIKA